MNRTVLIIILLISFTSLYSIDYGLSLDEGFSYSSSDPSLSSKVSVWTNLKIGKTGKFEFRSNIHHKTGNETDFPYFLDVDTLKLSWNFKKRYDDDPKTSITLGRYQVSDQTGRILSHKLDGLAVNFSFPFLSINNGIYYSGLLWKSSSGIMPSKLDIYHTNVEGSPLDTGSPRIIGMHKITLKKIYNLSFSSEILYQVDMRTDDVIEEYISHNKEGLVDSGGLLDTYYFSIKSSGAIPQIDNFNYSLSYAYNGGRSLSSVDNNEFYSYSQISAHLVNFKLNKFIPEFYNGFASYGFVYSSGDSDFIGYNDDNRKGLAEVFVPLSRSGFAVAFSPSIGNIMVNELSGSIKPMKQVQTTLKASLFNRTTTGPISESGVDPNSTDLFLGTGLDFIVNYRPLSDLGVTLITGLFIPSSGVFNEEYLEENGNVQGSISLNVSFSM